MITRDITHPAYIWTQTLNQNNAYNVERKLEMTH